jgi:hypothetical protein
MTMVVTMVHEGCWLLSGAGCKCACGSIFLVGLSPEQALAKVKHIHRVMRRNCRASRVLLVKTGSALTFIAGGYPQRLVQVTPPHPLIHTLSFTPQVILKIFASPSHSHPLLHTAGHPQDLRLACGRAQLLRRRLLCLRLQRRACRRHTPRDPRRGDAMQHRRVRPPRPETTHAAVVS